MYVCMYAIMYLEYLLKDLSSKMQFMYTSEDYLKLHYYIPCEFSKPILVGDLSQVSE